MPHEHHSSDFVQPMKCNTETTNGSEMADLHNLSPSELIARITSLETQLKTTTAQLTALTTSHAQQQQQEQQRNGSEDAKANAKPLKKAHKIFNPAHYSSRYIALKFSYIGTRYNGYEHANNATSATERPTIEEVIWKALRKGRLIGPEIPPGADQSYDVVWGGGPRAQRYGHGVEGEGRGKRGFERLELVWDGLDYSKCGRTDRGVSAFGQVIGIRVRSKKPLAGKVKKQQETSEPKGEVTAVEAGSMQNLEGAAATHANGLDSEVVPAAGEHADENMEGEEPDQASPKWDPVLDELPYISILNNILPPSIRMVAWCPHPPPTFDARFSCKERRYKYLFTNPAMYPTPGRLGMKKADGTALNVRDGWLDIEAMRKAAKKLEGLHDFRNLCKIDASKQMSSCERRITYADIEELESGVDDFMKDPRFGQTSSSADAFLKQLKNVALGGDVSGPKIYSFTVHGTAFLWHQVRCMVAVLFLVGQGLEQPDIIDKLLDIQATPGRPVYKMADDAPLVLWECVFPGDDPEEPDGMKWVYAGDEFIASGALGGRDEKFGPNGLVEQLWDSWRAAKMEETRAAALLGLVLSQGSTSLPEPEAPPPGTKVPKRSQRLFDGGSAPRYDGNYIPLMKREQLETLEVQNAKYAAGKGFRKDARKRQEAEANEVQDEE